MSLTTHLGRRCSSTRRARAVASRQVRIEALEDRCLMTLGGNQLFPSDNPWNQSVAAAPVAADSSAIINNIIARQGGDGKLHPDFGQDTGGSGTLYGIPYNVVHGNALPKINVVIGAYSGQSDIQAAPIPAGAVLEGDDQNGPVVGMANRGDSHLIVYDADTNIAYEFYHASRPSENADGKWHADQESVWNLNQDSFRPQDWTSADAAGLPILPGLVRPDEALPTSQGGQGAVDHAIRFTLSNSEILDQYVYPASHEANPSNTNAAIEPPMGTRFRLKASVNISGLSPESQVIAQAMKTYGLILADNGSNFFFSGASASVTPGGGLLTWNDNDIQSTTTGLKSLTFSDFEVVSTTPAVTGLSAPSGAAGSSVTITGQGFSGAAGHLQVLFGGAAATNVVVVDDSHVKATVPSGNGTVDVRVQSGVTTANDPSNVEGTVFGYGVSAVVAADRFTYSAADRPPVAVADTASTPAGAPVVIAVLANDSDPDGDPLTVASVIQPAHGSAAINANNTVTYSPAAGYSGQDVFGYTISDGRGGTATASVTISVTPPAQTKWIVNVGDPGYAETGKYWTTAWGTDAAGHTYRNNSSRTGTWTTPDTANWTVTGLASGVYQVYATWVSSPYLSTNSPFTVLDGATALGTARLNQQLAPADVTDGGRGWKLVGSYTISSGSLKVQLNDNANGTVSADAIRVVAGVGAMSMMAIALPSAAQPRYDEVAPPASGDGVPSPALTLRPVAPAVSPPRSSTPRPRWPISIPPAVSGNAGPARRPIPGSAI